MHNVESPVFRAVPVRIKGTFTEGWIIGEVRSILGKKLVVFEPVEATTCRVLDPLAVEPREAR